MHIQSCSSHSSQKCNLHTFQSRPSFRAPDIDMISRRVLRPRSCMRLFVGWVEYLYVEGHGLHTCKLRSPWRCGRCPGGGPGGLQTHRALRMQCVDTVRPTCCKTRMHLKACQGLADCACMRTMGRATRLGLRRVLSACSKLRRRPSPGEGPARRASDSVHARHVHLFAAQKRTKALCLVCQNGAMCCNTITCSLQYFEMASIHVKRG